LRDIYAKAFRTGKLFRRGRFARMGKVIMWRAFDGNLVPITLPLNNDKKKQMQEAYWDRMMKLIEEYMRKKRLQEKLDKIFSSSFIEEVPIPYLGVKLVRVWVVGDNIVLTSQFNDAEYDPKNGIEAQCANEMRMLPSEDEVHHVPWPTCTCGIYAYSMGTALNQVLLSSLADPDLYNIPFNVVVSLGGYVMHHKEGYRSSIAKIEAIVSPSNEWFVAGPSSMHPRSTPHLIKPGRYQNTLKKRGDYTVIDVRRIAEIYDVPIIHPYRLGDFEDKYKQRWGLGS
jgi:hypothetical protein